MLPGGAALLSAADDGRRAWVLIDDGTVARFGPALAWASRSGAASLDVIVDGPGGAAPAAGVVARRAACFAPAPEVWVVSGRSMAPAAAAPIVPADSDPPPADLVRLLEAHGLDAVWEHGVLRGEVLGLEVARTVGSRLEVGVGRHDRGARSEMRPSESLSEALDEAAAAVRSARRSGGPAHPANTLARARWLRSVVLASPASFGLSDLVGVAPPLPWFDLPEARSTPAVGKVADGGRPVVIVCSVGVDLDLVPTAADCRLIYGTGAGGSDSDLWLVMPEGDDVPVTHELAERLSPPAMIRTVARGWESLLE